jgi:hypothetical protein
MATNKIEPATQPRTAPPAKYTVNLCEVRPPSREGPTAADSDPAFAALQRQVALLSELGDRHVHQLADHQRQLTQLRAQFAARREQPARLEPLSDDAATEPTITGAATDTVLPVGSGATGETVAVQQADAHAEPKAPSRRRRRWFAASIAKMLRGGESMHDCELAASMWESPLFFGRPDAQMGRVVTLWAVLMLLLNALVQAMISVIVVLKMAPDAKIIKRTIADLWCALLHHYGLAVRPLVAVSLVCTAVCREWRVNVAHDLENVDPVTNVPLAARVCYGVAGLPFSFQVDKFQDIVNYQDGYTGPLLSALCAFMWFTKARPPLPTVPRRSPCVVLTSDRCAGRRRHGVVPDDAARRRAAARQDDALRRRRCGLGRHDSPRVLLRGAISAARRRVDAVLRRLVLHRAHVRSRRPDTQLHRARGARSRGDV